MAQSALDERLLRRSIELAGEKMQNGEGGPFGAVVAIDGRIVGEGWNRVTSRNDPTAHAEIEAIRNACRRLGRFDLRGAVLYASCEPCPMCLAAAYWARVARIVHAASAEQAAAVGFDDSLIRDELRLAPERRRLPMTRLLDAEGQAPLAAWAAKPDKTRY